MWNFENILLSNFLSEDWICITIIPNINYYCYYYGEKRAHWYM